MLSDWADWEQCPIGPAACGIVKRKRARSFVRHAVEHYTTDLEEQVSKLQDDYGLLEQDRDTLLVNLSRVQANVSAVLAGGAAMQQDIDRLRHERDDLAANVSQERWKANKLEQVVANLEAEKASLRAQLAKAPAAPDRPQGLPQSQPQQQPQEPPGYAQMTPTDAPEEAHGAKSSNDADGSGAFLSLFMAVAILGMCCCCTCYVFGYSPRRRTEAEPLHRRVHRGEESAAQSENEAPESDREEAKSDAGLLE